MESLQAGPSRGYYVLAAVVLFLGAGLLAIEIRKGLASTGGSFQQVAAPGKSDLALSAPGGYTIFYLSESVLNDGDDSNAGKVPGIECALISKASGAAVKLSPSASYITYEFDKRPAKSVYNFKIDHPGIYELTSSCPQGRKGPEIVLAVGHGVQEGIVKTVLGGIAILLGTFAVSGSTVVVTAVKRRKASNRLHG